VSVRGGAGLLGINPPSGWGSACLSWLMPAGWIATAKLSVLTSWEDAEFVRLMMRRGNYTSCLREGL
jgi:hypothetical protein